MTARELREKREKLIQDAGALVGPNNTFATTEARTSFDAMLVDADKLRVQIEDADRADKISALATESRASMPETQRTEPRAAASADATGVEARDRALGLYLRGVALGDMATEDRSALNYVAFDGRERRDMSTISGAAGGFVVSPDTRFYGTIIQAMKFFGGMESVGSEVIETDTGADLPIPMGDDTGNIGTLVAEQGSQASGTSPVLTSMTMHAYLYSSKVVKVSWQMLRDAAINVEGYVGGLLGERLARIQNTQFTTGTGGSQPYGLTTVASVGKQSAVGNTTSVPFDDVYRLVHSVDVAYRTSKPSVGFMFHDTTALAYRLAKDGNGRYLWPEMGSTQAGMPGTLAGYKFTINNDMPALGTSNKHTSFGDHSFYKIRRVKGITIVRINELYVEAGQVGFLAFQSADGNFADAGQHPVKLLQNSAT